MDLPNLFDVMDRIPRRSALLEFTQLELPDTEQRALVVLRISENLREQMSKISQVCVAYYRPRASPRMLDEQTLREATVKMFIDALTMAKELGISPFELCDTTPHPPGHTG